MFLFIVLGLAGGFLMSSLIWLYLKFETNNFEKCSHIVWVLGNAIYILCIIAFVFLPLSSFCTVNILKQNSRDALSNLRIFWIIPFMITTLVGVYDVSKKQEELRNLK
jgi:glycopeptide antibiotics resistance protein